MTRLPVLFALAVALVGCGGSEVPPRDPKLPAELGAELAAQADAVAASIDAGDSCGARDQAVALQSDVAEAIASGRVPRALRRELQSAVAELVAGIECVPPDPEPQPPTPSCEALEERKKELEEEKKALKETIEDEDERKAREQELEEEKRALDEELKACKEAEKD